jgi:hypothetical protein
MRRASVVTTICRRKVMAQQKTDPVRIELTEEQRKHVRAATGRDAFAIQFTAEELEERIAPLRIQDSED